MDEEHLANDIGTSTEVADEVIYAFGEMFPKLAVPQFVWRILREMIERECRGHYGDIDMSAEDLLECELTRKSAERSGLG